MKKRASEKEKRRVKNREKEVRETHLGAQKAPALREGEGQRKNYGERESEGY